MDTHLSECPIAASKDLTAKKLLDLALENIRSQRKKRMNLIWLEASGCSGNIISLMNAENPDINEFFRNVVELRYNNSVMQCEGEAAYKQLLDTLDTEFVLVVEGAVSSKNNGKYNIIASYEGRLISAAEAIKEAGSFAKHVIAVGTCASYGGITSARPNPSAGSSIDAFLGRKVIKVPGCPVHPDWIIGTVSALISNEALELDDDSRPLIFYGISIHDNCTRRSYFDNGMFAKRPGDKECMFKLGCRGPITRTDCPIRRWNNYSNWPVGDNTPCIGCAGKGFPDGMEPFIRI